MNRALLVKSVDKKISEIVTADIKILARIKKQVLISGGKRIRPVVHYYFAKMLDYDGQEWRDVAAIGELIHAASLLHDDVIDGADERRGRPTVNVIYGNKPAILAGDFLLGCGFDHLRTLHDALPLFEIFTRVIRMLSVGELLQMEWEKNLALKDEIYRKIILGKTGSLFGAMVESAAVLSGLEGAERRRYRDFGERMGHLFQIRDDYLDYFSEETGKPPLQDFRRGLVTKPLLILMRRLGGSDRAAFKRVWLSDAVRNSAEGIGSLRRYLEKSGVQRLLFQEIELEIHALMKFVRGHNHSMFREGILTNLSELVVPL
jgi:octaprenyl-diphosphate synthase